MRPCCPAVVCISPNGEAFDNGDTYDFGTILSDDTYGDLWQAVPFFSINDPLWQTPRRPCDYAWDTFTWTEDDGSCNADVPGSVRYYPAAPQVEPRCAIPDCAPTMPVGTSIAPAADYPVPLSFDTGGSGAPITVPTPWSVAIAKQDCVCAPGRFSSEYQEDGARCPADEFIP